TGSTTSSPTMFRRYTIPRSHGAVRTTPLVGRPSPLAREVSSGSSSTVSVSGDESDVQPADLISSLAVDGLAIDGVGPGIDGLRRGSEEGLETREKRRCERYPAEAMDGISAMDGVHPSHTPLDNQKEHKTLHHHTHHHPSSKFNFFRLFGHHGPVRASDLEEARKTHIGDFSIPIEDGLSISPGSSPSPPSHLHLPLPPAAETQPLLAPKTTLQVPSTFRNPHYYMFSRDQHPRSDCDEGFGRFGFGLPLARSLTGASEVAACEDEEGRDKLGVFRGVVVPT
ncbi:hypothetical protein HK097_006478, partial [Rhizophlyctis rosea]